jgi:hypothetical protein
MTITYSSEEVSTLMGVCCDYSMCSIGFFPLGDFLGILVESLLGGIMSRRRVKDKLFFNLYNI